MNSLRIQSHQEVSILEHHFSLDEIIHVSHVQYFVLFTFVYTEFAAKIPTIYLCIDIMVRFLGSGSHLDFLLQLMYVSSGSLT